MLSSISPGSAIARSLLQLFLEVLHQFVGELAIHGDACAAGLQQERSDVGAAPQVGISVVCPEGEPTGCGLHRPEPGDTGIDQAADLLRAIAALVALGEQIGQVEQGVEPAGDLLDAPVGVFDELFQSGLELDRWAGIDA